MGSFSIWHWMIVLAVILIIFGAGKLPRVMGDLAKGIKSFKAGMKDEDAVDASPPAAATPPVVPAVPPAAPFAAPPATPGAAISPSTAGSASTGTVPGTVPGAAAGGQGVPPGPISGQVIPPGPGGPSDRVA